MNIVFLVLLYIQRKYKYFPLFLNLSQLIQTKLLKYIFVAIAIFKARYLWECLKIDK